jgi:ABC-type transport system involved in multi-copper enzyme maturation permease subunit
VPVFEQTYPRWRPAPGARRRPRWWPIVRRELQQLGSQKAFQALLVIAALPALVHLLQVYSVNELISNPSGQLAQAMRQVSLTIDAEFFFRFLQLQMYFVFLLVLYASSGLVCDDVRLNLIEVYFSKPLTVRDYLVGKLVTVVGLGLVYTALPALLLLAAQLLMAPDASFARDELPRVLPASLALSLVIVLPMALCTLACSAMTTSRGFAAATLAALLGVDGFVALLLAELLDERAANVLNVPAAMHRVGEALFGLPADLPLAWPWALLVVGGVSALAFALLRARLRSVDLGGA